MALHTSFLAYRDYRYLKVSVLLMIASTTVYLMSDPPGGRNGTTIVGYGLGILSAAMVAWLLWLGVRKRSYGATGAPVQGWVSAHVYLGGALPLLVALHCGFDFGRNVHTLAYLLLLLTVLSGVVGVVLYRILPAAVSENRSGEMTETQIGRIAEIDSQLLRQAQQLPDAIAEVVSRAIAEPLPDADGATFGGDARGATARAIEQLVARSQAGETQSLVSTTELEPVSILVAHLAVRQRLLERLHQDQRLRGLLRLWLVVHVPASIALAVAIPIHVIAVLWFR